MTRKLTSGSVPEIKFTWDTNNAVDLSKPLELSASKAGSFVVYIKAETLGGIAGSGVITVNGFDCSTTIISNLNTGNYKWKVQRNNG